MPESPLGAACWAAAVTVLAIAVIIWLPIVVGLEKPQAGKVIPPGVRREKYGPPPGRARAVALSDLPSRGVHEWDRVNEGSSAGSLAHYIERSA